MPTVICNESDSTSDCVVSSDGAGDTIPRDDTNGTSCSAATGGTPVTRPLVSLVSIITFPLIVFPFPLTVVNAECCTLCRCVCNSGFDAAFWSSALIIFSVFSLAACSTMRWLRTLSLAKAEASSSVARACLARSCHAIARSVRHCRASPSGRRTGSFCSETRSERIVSRRGRRDRRHNGHRNLRSLAAWTREAVLLLFLRLADFGRGTQVPARKGYKLYWWNWKEKVYEFNKLTQKLKQTYCGTNPCRVHTAAWNQLVLFYKYSIGHPAPYPR